MITKIDTRNKQMLETFHDLSRDTWVDGAILTNSLNSPTPSLNKRNKFNGGKKWKK